MRIAFVAVKNIQRGGGIEKYTLELGSRLAARGHDVTVYSMRHYGPVPRTYRGMRIVRVPSIPAACLEKLSASAVAAAIAAWKGHDVVHFHSVASGAFAWLARLRGCKCVLQMHGLEWKRTRWGRLGTAVLRRLEGLCLPQSHIRTAVSQTQCDYFQRDRGIDMVYIPTGTDLKQSRPAREILRMGLAPEQYLLFASRLVPEKGADILIRAFRSLDTDCKLLVAGDAHGEEAYKRHLLELAGGDPRIVFAGYVEGDLLEELFSNALVYVQPSQIEGLSIALLEAMSYGNCCLVSDIPENLEAIGGQGWTFRNGEVRSLADRLQWLMDHPDEARQSADKAKHRVAAQYAWDDIADRFEAMYSDLVSGATCGRQKKCPA
jgi:glycosyltransferase involved in cell wall biosynthesis